MLKMNETEQFFYKYLLESGIKKENIEFFINDSPDFIVDGKIGYEVKRKISNSIVTSKKQIRKILNKDIKSFFVAIDEYMIIEEIPITEDILDKKNIGDINIIWENENLIGFFEKIDPKILYNWRETITGNETFRARVEEALKDNTTKHRKILKEKYKNDF